MAFLISKPACTVGSDWVWPVVQCAEKLAIRQRHVSERGERVVLAGAWAYDRLQDAILGGAALPDIEPESPISLLDVNLTSLVNSNLDLFEGAAVAEAFRSHFGATFAGVHPAFGPVGADLLEVDVDARARLAELLSRIQVPGARLSKVSKVLALKRPNLVPILDAVVQRMLMGEAWDDQSTSGVRPILDAFVDAARASIGRCGPPTMSPVRATEKLLWFDGIFPWGWQPAEGTARWFVDEGWRVVVWPMDGGPSSTRAGAVIHDDVEYDGCVFLPRRPPRSAPHAGSTLAFRDLDALDQAVLTRELTDAGYDSHRKLPTP